MNTLPVILFLIFLNGDGAGYYEHARYATDAECVAVGRQLVAREPAVKGYICSSEKGERIGIN
jgi:hypothetical protein